MISPARYDFLGRGMDVFVFLREYLQEVDAPDESLFVVYLDVGHDELGEVDVGLVERREESGVVHRGCIVGGHRGSERGRFSERAKMLKKTGSEMRCSRSFVERSALTRSAYIKCVFVIWTQNSHTKNRRNRQK